MNGNSYWTISPCGTKRQKVLSNFILSSNGEISIDEITRPKGIRPVINLKSDVIISSGDGTESNPFVVN